MSVDPNGASLHHGFWQNYGQRPGQGGRKLLIETRIPDALSVDPDPGCPFLGDGPTGTWSLARVARGICLQPWVRSVQTREHQANINSSNRIRLL